MSDEKSLVKITNKYLCMVSGKKLMEPCDGCENPKGCLSRAMQYKETEEMAQQEEKAILKINADGEVASCAKGLEAKECGYKGGKVCGACGAMAVEMKANDEEMADDDMDEEEMSEEKMSYDMDEEDGKKKKKAMDADADKPESEEEDDEEEEMMEPDEMPKGMGMMAPTREGRRRAIKRVAGKKSDDLGDLDDAFICQLERKAYAGSDDVCANCPGGCASEGGMPGVADIEGMALDMFGGKVLSSGYADDADLFIVDVMAKDGYAVELIADGSSGELLNFHRLNTDDISGDMGVKSLEDGALVPQFIDIKSAQDIALNVIYEEIDTKGEVIQADSDIFEGYDSYVFEIDGVNGKSYDVFVGLDGTVLGYDEYDAVEAEDIEAEAAELALKRAYSDDQRESMAESGEALPDGSYPIKDEEDLRNAIQAYGRAKNKERAKAHIIKRAMDLGKEDLIPENWVPKKIQEEAAAEEEGEKSAVIDADQADLLKNLIEFEMLAEEIGDTKS